MTNHRWTDKITYRAAFFYCIWWFVCGMAIGMMMK